MVALALKHDVFEHRLVAPKERCGGVDEASTRGTKGKVRRGG
ncbi:hypothetical protein RchiOBHm_Chr6g0264471 [Rosa chinensis]|uniref:Uncharacterized protein n=1 Tax=Rosa chinensis TaxID=74649 RepID=A0A2P6PP65_ROSCH|nr:hypothetical protein RchiOBHm_Chr6g0264471 [Rosa chinensis]